MASDLFFTAAEFIVNAHYENCHRCIDFLREKANCTPPEGALSEAEEAAVSRSLELVRFLLEAFHPVRAWIPRPHAIIDRNGP